MKVRAGDWVTRVGYPTGKGGFPQTFADVLPNTAYLVTATDPEKESVTIRTFVHDTAVGQTFWAGNFRIVSTEPSL